MRAEFLTCLAVILTTSLAAPAAAGDDAPLTSRQMRALSAQKANRQVRRDLNSILKGTGKIARGNRVAVSTVWIQTKSYGTQFPGLCRSDNLFLNYNQLEDRPSEDSPIRPYGVESTASYRVVGAVRQNDWKHSRQETTWQPACAGLNDEHWFSASNDVDAYEGVVVLREATTRLKTDTSPVFDCTKANLPKDRDCKQTMLAAMAVANLKSIDACEPAATHCRHYDLGEWTMTILTDWSGGDAGPPRIEKIELDGPNIIVT